MSLSRVFKSLPLFKSPASSSLLTPKSTLLKPQNVFPDTRAPIHKHQREDPRLKLGRIQRAEPNPPLYKMHITSLLATLLAAPLLVSAKPGVYLCSKVWQDCKWYAPDNECHNFPRTIIAFGPDDGVVCELWGEKDCFSALHMTGIKHPGFPDWRYSRYLRTYMDTPTSFKCKMK